jgi:hypothetical protein
MAVPYPCMKTIRLVSVRDFLRNFSTLIQQAQVDGYVVMRRTTPVGIFVLSKKKVGAKTDDPDFMDLESLVEHLRAKDIHLE